MELQRQVRFSGLACDQIILSSSVIDPPARRDSCWAVCHTVMEMVLCSSHYKTHYFLTSLTYSRTLHCSPFPITKTTAQSSFKSSSFYIWRLLFEQIPTDMSASFPLLVEHCNNTVFWEKIWKVVGFFLLSHMVAVGAIVSLQCLLLVICDQISLCNDTA